MKNNLKLLIFILLLLIFGFTYRILIKDKETLLVFYAPTKLMSEAYPESWAQENTSSKVLTILNVGESALLLDKKTEKEFQSYKIKLKNGQIGFVFSGDSFREQKKPE